MTDPWSVCCSHQCSVKQWCNQSFFLLYVLNIFFSCISIMFGRQDVSVLIMCRFHLVFCLCWLCFMVISYYLSHKKKSWWNSKLEMRVCEYFLKLLLFYFCDSQHRFHGQTRPQQSSRRVAVVSLIQIQQWMNRVWREEPHCVWHTSTNVLCLIYFLSSVAIVLLNSLFIY